MNEQVRQPHMIKASVHNWIMQEIAKQAKARGIRHHTNVVTGLMGLQPAQWTAEGRDWYYIDHSYFKRGWHNGHIRVIRNGCHLNLCKPRPDDRMKKFDVVIEPWRMVRGSKIVVIPTYDGHHRIYPGMQDWVRDTVLRLKELTSRPVVIKQGKGGLREFLEDAWAIVTNMSVAGMEAALMGVPVFAAERCCAAPVSAGPLEKIESPEFPERHDWVTGLTYASWHVSELEKVNWIDYDYALRDDLP